MKKGIRTRNVALSFVVGALYGILCTVLYKRFQHKFVSRDANIAEKRDHKVEISSGLQLHLDGFNWGDKRFFGNTYMKRRSEYTYYTTVLNAAKQYAPNATSVIDVGAPWPYVTAFDWIPEKVMLNDRYPASMNASIPGLSIIQTDFYKFNPERKFDLVLCNQVMEHVSQPGKFAQKLLEIGNIVIASVPYMWPEESGFGHLQHKISIDKFLGWFERVDYSELGIVRESARKCAPTCRRIYVVFLPPVAEEDKIHNPTHKERHGQE